MGFILFCVGFVLFIGLCCYLGRGRQDAPPWDNHTKWGNGAGLAS
jgi:hypothetical protein